MGTKLKAGALADPAPVHSPERGQLLLGGGLAGGAAAGGDGGL